ncbi:MAG: urate hydroxylase PuuD [Stellaceae bacterium]
MQWTELVSYGWWARAGVPWLHVLAGMMWLGYIWYFNFTYHPTVSKIPQEYRPGAVRYILPDALFWLRWSALATIVTGLVLAWMSGVLESGFRLGIDRHDAHATAIGIGMWLAILMAANVWFVIWPNQRTNLGYVPRIDARRRARAARIATLASRVNLMLSIPMLYGMTAAHFY